MKFAFIVAVVAAAAVSTAATAVLAQSDPVKQRETLMKENNQHAKTVVQMIKGEKAFDPAAVEAAFDQWADTAEKMPDLFPASAKTGGDNRASPKIWENKADFNAKIAAFAKVVADNRDKAVSSVDGLKVAVSAVGKVCGDCHEDYRLSK
jgi:cytochrome c556